LKLTAVYDYVRLRKWAFLKILIILYCASWGPIPSAFYSQDKLPEILLIFSFTILASIGLITIQVYNPYSPPCWKKPSLKANPFSMREPIQTFHFLSVCALSAGIKIFFQAVYLKIGNLEGARFLAMGVGLFLGTRLSILIFRRKLTNK
jgi:hypothetical protein